MHTVHYCDATVSLAVITCYISTPTLDRYMLSCSGFNTKTSEKSNNPVESTLETAEPHRVHANMQQSAGIFALYFSLLSYDSYGSFSAHKLLMFFNDKGKFFTFSFHFPDLC